MACARLRTEPQHGRAQEGAVENGGPGEGNALGPEAVEHIQYSDGALILGAGPSRCLGDEGDVALQQLAGPDTGGFHHGQEIRQPGMDLRGQSLPKGDGETTVARGRAGTHRTQDPGDAALGPGLRGPGETRREEGEERGRPERSPAARRDVRGVLAPYAGHPKPAHLGIHLRHGRALQAGGAYDKN